MRHHKPFPVHRTALVLPALALLAAACDPPVATGTANAVMVATPAERWVQIRDEVEEGLEPRAFTVRDERMFSVTHADPMHERWPRLREFRRVMVIGTAEEQFMAAAVSRLPDGVSPPAVVELENVWARNQQVIVLLLPADRPSDQVVPALLPEALELVHRDFGEYVLRRMYASGVHEDALARMHRTTGARMRLPGVYRDSVLDDSTHHAWNDHPDPSERFRSVLVRWRDGRHEPTPDAALAWRSEVAETAYIFDQVTEDDRIEARSVRSEQWEGVEIKGIWTFPPEAWPGAGSFLSRMLYCPERDRTYLVDTWIYSPGRDQYEFQLQLRTILDSFRCD